MQGPSVYVLEALAADAAERGESDRWAECIWVAPPRNRNRSEMQLAFDEFTRRTPRFEAHQFRPQRL